MSDRPFQCPKCLNWYTPVPVEGNGQCILCLDGKHGVHPKKNTYDCHFGHVTAHPSEVKMIGILEAVNASIQTVGECQERCMQARTGEVLSRALSQAEVSFSKAETAMGKMPEVLRWSEVMELPGLKDAPMAARFKHIDAIFDLVQNNRRPHTDLEMLQRSSRICREIAADVTARMAELRTAMTMLRQAVQQWRPAAAESVVPEAAAESVVPEAAAANKARVEAHVRRMAHARAAKKVKQPTPA